VFQHPFEPRLRRPRWMAAALVMTLLIGLTLPATAEVTPRPVVFHPWTQGGQARGWGPFTFGMDASEAAQAALQSGGRLGPALGTAATGEPFTYHGPSHTRDGRRRAGDYALIWFDQGRLSRVTVVLFRRALTHAGACLATHRHSVARVLASGGALEAAATARDMQHEPDQVQQHAQDGSDTTWVAEVRRSGSRVVVETSWEDPASARQAGADETCIATVTYLPGS
jgi:hypothetical protein